MFSLTRNKSRVKSVWAGRVADHVIDLGWSADGRYLAAAASTGPITIFDAKAGTGDTQLAGHANGTLALGWSPKQSLVATAGKDRRVRLWEPNGREVACLETSAVWVAPSSPQLRAVQLTSGPTSASTSPISPNIPALFPTSRGNQGRKRFQP
jgi:WD40 repeat protein